MYSPIFPRAAASWGSNARATNTNMAAWLFREVVEVPTCRDTGASPAPVSPVPNWYRLPCFVLEIVVRSAPALDKKISPATLLRDREFRPLLSLNPWAVFNSQRFVAENKQQLAALEFTRPATEPRVNVFSERWRRTQTPLSCDCLRRDLSEAFFRSDVLGRVTAALTLGSLETITVRGSAWTGYCPITRRPAITKRSKTI